jgi:hypothetical protein
MDYTWDRLAVNKWLSTLDWKNGEWKLALHLSDKKTAFYAGQSLWQVIEMQFSHSSTPATIEHLICTFLPGLTKSAWCTRVV